MDFLTSIVCIVFIALAFDAINDHLKRRYSLKELEMKLETLNQLATNIAIDESGEIKKAATLLLENMKD